MGGTIPCDRGHEASAAFVVTLVKLVLRVDIPCDIVVVRFAAIVACLAVLTGGMRLGGSVTFALVLKVFLFIVVAAVVNWNDWRRSARSGFKTSTEGELL